MHLYAIKLHLNEHEIKIPCSSVKDGKPIDSNGFSRFAFATKNKCQQPDASALRKSDEMHLIWNASQVTFCISEYLFEL